MAINSNKYLTLSFKNELTIVKPLRTSENELIAFCYIKNKERCFSIRDIINVQIKNHFFVQRLSGPKISLDKISKTINTAIDYHKFIRMKYTSPEWTTYQIDNQTGDLTIAERKEAEESIRTISNIKLSINDQSQESLSFIPDERHITAYCHLREEKRNFRFDRVSEIEILDL